MKWFRNRLGLSQEEFGIHLGVGAPQVAISQFESGERKISRRLEKSIESWKENIKLQKKLSQQVNLNNGTVQ